MPNFDKTEADLETRLDKWLYFIKHLEDFQNIPGMFKDEVFTQAFEKAELAKFDQAELDSYEYSLKSFRDNKATFDYAMETAYDEGREKGILYGKLQGKSEGKLEIIKIMKSKGLSVKAIAELTGLAENEIEKLN